MNKIISLFGNADEEMRKLNDRASVYAKQNGYAYEWIPQEEYREVGILRCLENADAAIIDVDKIDAALVAQLSKKLKILVRFGAGYDTVDLSACKERNIAVARTTAANANGVAEMAISLILACKRMLKQQDVLIHQGQWRASLSTELSDSTVGIVGFGAIGKKVAERLKSFNCRILANDVESGKEIEEKYGVEFKSLEEIFAQSDAITIHLPSSESTRHIINKSLLSIMQPHAVLVNTSRGSVINESDLYNALKDKRISGAGLDVMEVEPIDNAHPLLELDNIILTAHSSSKTLESFWNTYKMAIDIIKEYDEIGTSTHILNGVMNR